MRSSSPRLRHDSATLSSLKARVRAISTLAVLVLLLGWAARPAAAIVVNLTDNSEASLDAALTSTRYSDSSMIVVQFSGTTSITSEKLIEHNVTIDATGYNYTIDAGGRCRHFTLSEGYGYPHTVTLTNIHLLNGRAVGSNPAGGSIYADKYSTLILRNCELGNNTALASGGSATGGAIFSSGKSVTLTNCSIHDNRAVDSGGGAFGGAVYGPITASNCLFDRNRAIGSSSASGSGSGGYGGVACTVSASSFTSCRFKQNSAIGGNGTTKGGDAGGGAVDTNTGVVMQGCSFIGNSAAGGTAGLPANHGSGWGGAVACDSSGNDIANCTFDGNQVTGPGNGAAARVPSGTLTNCTFADNGSGMYAARALSCAGTIYLQNVVLARNPGGNVDQPLYATDFGGNISDDYTVQFTDAGSKIVTGAILGPLSPDTSGLQYVPLLPGSPAIGYGNPSGAPATDMLGVSRAGRIDSGAVQFTGAPVQQTTTRFDLHGNGSSDILWSNNVTGQVAVWQMNAGNYMSCALLPTVSDTNWAPVGIGDFNGDMSNDILWQNRATGDVGFWPMNGTSRLAPLYVPLTNVADTNWQIVAVADFNGDGKPDLLWRNKATGQNLIWLMNGTTYLSTSFLPWEPDQGWKVAGVADFDGDGKKEIIFQHAVTGYVVYWKLNGANFTACVNYGPMAPAWQIAGAGNFGGANGADLLWRNKTTGEVLIWQMNKGVWQSHIILSTTTLDWQIRGMR